MQSKLEKLQSIIEEQQKVINYLESKVIDLEEKNQLLKVAVESRDAIIEQFNPQTNCS